MINNEMILILFEIKDFSVLMFFLYFCASFLIILFSIARAINLRELNIA